MHTELYLIEENELKKFQEKPRVPESDHGDWKGVHVYVGGGGG